MNDLDKIAINDMKHEFCDTNPCIECKTTPVVESLKVREASIQLSAEMTLASIKVRVNGTYNIHSNTYYPYNITEIGESGYPLEKRDFDLEEYCEQMGWDYFETHEAIQEAVEKR